ncbi:MAG: ABC transporter permease, partial [Clostridiales bacterium]|nr:ABC transporter permease [Clostridiales bacterium]
MKDLFFLVPQTMYYAIPLLIVALGGMFSERGGVVNIALEGIMIFGAFTGIVFINIMQSLGSKMPGDIMLLIALLLAAAMGVAVSLAHAYASINLKSDQVISGTAINMLAPAFAIFVGRLLGDTQTQQIPFKNVFRYESFPLLGRIPIIGDLFFKQAYITTYMGFLILIAAWWVLYKTKFGMRLRACGEHPQAADSAGINVYKIRYAGVILSGALAGIGGLVFIIPSSVEFNATVAGYGFLALAVLIFGQWKPPRILMAAFFFGLLKTVAASSSGLNILKGVPIPNSFYKMMPFVITLIVLAFTSRKSMAPRA